MTRGRQRDQWNHTAQLSALLYNAFRGRGRALGPSDFHPFSMQEECSVALLKQLIEGAQQGAQHGKRSGD